MIEMNCETRSTTKPEYAGLTEDTCLTCAAKEPGAPANHLPPLLA